MVLPVGVSYALTSWTGNVSYECPSVHFYHVIEAPAGSQNHTPGFTKYGGTKDAHNRCLNSAKGMAVAAWAVLSDDPTAEQVRQEFEDGKRQRELVPAAK